MTHAASPLPSALSARGLTVRLARRLVLHDVSLDLAAGELCVLVGPNGAGKSTLLRALAGTIPLEAGHMLRTSSADPLSHVAYLPQDRIVHWDLSAARLVALGRQKAAGALGASDLAAVEQAMRRMDVLHLTNRPASQLSGGERARLLMARALAQEAPVLLADEPAAGLDPAHQLELFELLRAQARDGKAVLVALHDLTFALRYADRAILLRAGQIVAEGPPTQSLSAANIAAVFGINAQITHVDGIPVLIAHAAYSDVPRLP